MATSEEAWTAQQYMIQVETSAQAEAERNNAKVKEIEMQAERLVFDSTHVATQEREKNH